MASTSRLACKNLVLDAGPLLSLSPLRGLAQKYLTVPQVLDELKDRRAREHFEQLGLSAGVQVEIRSPDAASLARVIEFAKKTGDYAVLSHADLCVLALTYALNEEEKSFEATNEAISGDLVAGGVSEPAPAIALDQEFHEGEHSTLATEGAEASVVAEALKGLKIESSDGNETDVEEKSESASGVIVASSEDAKIEPIDSQSNVLEALAQESSPTSEGVSDQVSFQTKPSDVPLYDDPSDEDDGEGEWITPSNVALHKSRALDLLPASGSGKEKTSPVKPILAGCMTADFAMQNVLLQMNLSLVNTEGKRIERVKTWVLRCHACFKICKDVSKKFCPSCGGATLLRVSVTIASPDAGPNVPAMQVHLKKNFQYRLRGTIYSIPAPKPGSAKTGSGEGLILREDQAEYMRAQKMADSKRARDERRMMSGALAAGARGDDSGVRVGSWMDPDWVPEMLTVGAGGKGRSNGRGKGDMPVVGYGRRNPNERRRKVK